VTALTHDLGMEAVLVSRQPAGKAIAYEDLKDTSFLRKFSLVVNATPLGMAPQVAGSPPVPFEHLSKDCVLVDLVYNPTETAFLRKGREYGLDGRGGLDMLHRQAEASWKIWNT
jgi:shikimate dehydrogenase